MRSSRSGPAIAILGLAIWAGPTAAGDNGAALRCASIGDDSARLACYDGIFRVGSGAGGVAHPPTTASGAATAATGTAAAGTAATGTAAAVVATKPPSAANPVADFGLTPEQQRQIDPVKAAEARAPESISASVSKVGFKATGELVVTLESGQVWVQIDTGNKSRLKAGDSVTIKRGSLGSYLLIPPNKVAIRVRRLK